MKSSYKLYGTYWDHKDSIDISECIVIPSTQGLNYKHPFCLLDLFDEYRTIGIGELLSIDNCESFDSVCNTLSHYKNIAITIDYMPSLVSPTASEFYEKKLCQIYFALQQALPNSRIVIQVPSNNVPEWKTLQNRFLNK